MPPTAAISGQIGSALSWPAVSFALLIAALLSTGYILLRRYRSRQLLHQRIAELEALSVAGRALVAAKMDVDSLAELIANEAGQVIDNDTFQVGLFEENSYHILHWKINGVRQQTPQTFDLHEEGGIISWVRQSKSPLLVRDFQREINNLPARPRYISNSPPRSAIFIPMISGDTTIGILAAQSNQPNRFSEEDMRRLTILANQAAAAIAHALLFAQERQRAAHLELVVQISLEISKVKNQDEIFSRVVQLTQQTFNFHLVNIFGIDPETGEAVMQASSDAATLAQNWRIQPGHGLVGTAVSSQQTIISNNTKEDARFVTQNSPLEANTQAEMALPLMVDGEVVGVLDVQSPKAGMFTRIDKMTLEALSAEIAVSISKLRQLARQREQAWFTTAQLQVAEAVNRSRSIDEILTAVARLTTMLAGVPFCFILLWDKETAVYKGTESFGLSKEDQQKIQRQRLKIGEWSALDAVHVGQEAISTYKMPAWLTLASAQQLMLLPVYTVTDILGVLVVSNADQSKEAANVLRPPSRRTELLDNITQQLARGLENWRLRNAQQEEAWVNTALFQVAAAVNSLIDLNEILDTIARLVPMLVGVESCIILVWDEKREHFKPGASFGINEMGRGLLETLALNLNEFDNLAPKLTDGLSPTGTYYVIQLPDWLEKVLGTEQAFAFPLNARGQLVGAMVIGSMMMEESRSLSARRLNILTGIAHQAATAVVNHQLYQEAAERSRLERELDVAREIQASLIPDGEPNIPGCSVASYWQAARQVSGDFYDFIPLYNGNWGILVADVTDKGIPAALFMALCRTILRTVAISRDDPATTLIRANEIINQDTQSDLFVTVFYAIWEPDSQQIRYANGGHNPPLLLRQDSECSLLKEHGMALGVLPEIDMKSHTVQFLPEDTLILYTDGVTEAMNEDLDEFGMERLRQAAVNSSSLSARHIAQNITNAIQNHAGGTPQFDDITLVVMKRQAEGNL
ncbi:Serine phosphatase RsbU, regulator of sigma subunit [hydrothermal vent metagenome]|uniref:Serine phosphatase RsbU, regulator of sigma subunit n=1 Tax=hydrothermal vent metagenome TaxID=652676 RepID=A0A3B0W6U9_9ZZZZ